MKRHGKAVKTIEAYGLAVRRLAPFVNRCPDDLTTDELNRFFEWLIDTMGWSTVKLDRPDYKPSTFSPHYNATRSSSPTPQ